MFVWPERKGSVSIYIRILRSTHFVCLALLQDAQVTFNDYESMLPVTISGIQKQHKVHQAGKTKLKPPCTHFEV